jgi:hypothetical protein
LEVDPDARLIHGTTDNVARLALTLRLGDDGEPCYVLQPKAPVTIELDGQRIDNVVWPQTGVVRLIRAGYQWTVAPAPPDAFAKSPQRGGPFKNVFNNHVALVYGTRGNPHENAWAYAKARYDAETFWVRGNGAFEVMADTEFNFQAAQPDSVYATCNVVLYGNADTNAAWLALFSRSPVQVLNGRVILGAGPIRDPETHPTVRNDLAVLALYPRPRSDTALVGVVAGSGLSGLRLTERLPYFVSGVAYPDWIVMAAEVLAVGAEGVVATGFFDNAWKLDAGQSSGTGY